jgi:hypothetical protein
MVHLSPYDRKDCTTPPDGFLLLHKALLGRHSGGFSTAWSSPLMTTTVPVLDALTRAFAPLLPLVVSGGALWHGRGHSSFWDLWSEGQGTYLRAGRLELVLDRKTAPKSSS